MTESAELVDVWFNTIKQHRSLGSFCTQQPLTPFLLVEEITQRLSLDSSTRVCVFYTVEWAIYLQAVVGVKDITVAVQDHDPVVKNLCDHWGFKYLKNILLMTNPPKFDVVVGNPPYQKGKNNKFYQEFVKIAFELSSDIVAMITPSNWTSYADSSSSFTAMVKENGLLVYKYLTGDAFSVQLLTVYFVCSKRNQSHNVAVEAVNDSAIMHIDDLFYFPSQTTKALPILKSLKSRRDRGLVANKGALDRNKAILDPDGVPCIFSAGKVGEDFDWANVSKSHLTSKGVVGLGQHKVVISRVTSIGKLGAAKYADPSYAVAQGTYYIAVANEPEATGLISYLQSKLVSLIVNELKGAVCSNSKNIFSFIPAVDLTRSWTDAELYEHFSLTEEEIAYIEATVK